MNIIGHIHSCFPEKFISPRQSNKLKNTFARIEMAPQWQPEIALQGLEDFSHIWILWQFHQSHSSAYKAKVHPPRLEGETKGVFATRSPHRPNPIGLSLVRLIKIEGKNIYVDGVDMTSGTPVYDIKPYIPEFDSAADANSGWLEQNPFPKLKVEFSSQFMADLNSQAVNSRLKNIKLSSEDFQNLIADLVSDDPRAPAYKRENKEDKNQFGFCLYDFNILIKIENQKVEVLKIEILT